MTQNRKVLGTEPQKNTRRPQKRLSDSALLGYRRLALTPIEPPQREITYGRLEDFLESKKKEFAEIHLEANLAKVKLQNIPDYPPTIKLGGCSE